MELGAENRLIGHLDRGSETTAIGGAAGLEGDVAQLQVKAVHKIKVALVRDAFEQHRPGLRHYLVPTDMRNSLIGILPLEPDDRSVDESEALQLSVGGSFGADARHQLHPETSAEQ